ncbi:MAG TPA: diacylglycerol kinase family protein [Micromonosporaceae bacterium]|nr:diacylglycerol kinase family protein [Micromonosporaceae bacterium]
MPPVALGAGPVAVLVNPDAARGRYRAILPAVVARLGRRGGPVEVLEATTAAAARQACQRAVAGGAAALVAVGGDGTVHVALQAVAGRGVPLAVVAAGTGNDFATELGLPTDPVAAADVAALALGTGITRAIDLARVTGPAGGARIAGPAGGAHWYGAVLGAGFDGLVNERANRMRFPRGPRRYDVAILAELAGLRARRYTLGLDDDVVEVDAVLVAVGNTASYGGGMRICPAADPTDGMLDVVVVGAVSRATLLRIKPRLYTGRHVEHPAVTQYRARRVEIASAGLVAYADGERSLALPITITSHPGVLTLLA